MKQQNVHIDACNELSAKIIEGSNNSEYENINDE